MKRTKRVLAMILALLLMFSDLTGLFPEMAAHAEDKVLTLGSEEVSDTPEELQRLGEWVYWIEENGTATVAGYGGGETSLAIPARLGGHSVTGIGHGAFSANAGLTEVLIPTNVTRIADDAFAGLDPLTLKAYHGAYALRYAQEHRIGSECINPLPGVEFADGVIDLTGLPVGSYRDLTETGAAFKASEASFLTVGQIVFFPISEAFRGGLVRRVIGLEYSGSTLYAAFAEPAWTEAFDRVFGEEDIILDWDNAVFYESEELEYLESSLTLDSITDWGINDRDFELEEVQQLISEVTEAMSGDPAEEPTEEAVPAETVEPAEEAVPAETVEPAEEAVSAEAVEPAEEDVSAESAEPVEEVLPAEAVEPVEEVVSAEAVEPVEEVIPAEAVEPAEEVIPAETVEPVEEVIPAEAVEPAEEIVSAEVVEPAEEIVSAEAVEPVEEVVPAESVEPVEEVIPAAVEEPAEEVISAAVEEPEEYIESVPVLEWNSDWEDVTDGEVEAAWDILHPYDFNNNDESGKVNYNEDGSKKVKVEFGNVKGTFKLILKGGRVKYDIKTKWLLLIPYPSIDSLDIFLPLSPSFSVSYNPEKKAEKKILDVPYFTVGFASGNISVKWISKVSGEFKLTCELDLTVNMQYKNGKFKNNSKMSDPVFKPEINASVETGPKIAIDLRLGTGAISITLLEFNFTAKLIFKGSATTFNIRSGTQTIHSCVEAKVSVKGSVGYKFGLVAIAGKDIDQIIKKIKLTFSDDYDLFDKDLGSIHFDDMIKSGRASDCTIKDRLIIATINGKSKEYECDVNTRLPDPGTPSLTGYKFLGWYVNTKASGLSGNDYKINFGYDYMPYCDRDGTLYIYAKFEKIPEPIKVSGVKLNKSSLTLLTTDTSGVQLTATVSPSNAADKTVTWKSSNTKVATVSGSGLVKAVGPGTATITCTSKMVSSKSASCSVTVKKPPVSSLTLNKSSVSLSTRDQNGVQLTATLNPRDVDDSTVTWKSSNTGVVTVSGSGLVKVVGPGTATVTCTSKSNSSAKASCSFTVARPPVTGVSLDRTEALLYTNNRNGLQLTATVSPADAEQSLNWSSSDTSVVTVSGSGLVRVVGLGTATVTAASSASPSMQASCAVTVTEPPVTGITLDPTEIVMDLNDTEGVQIQHTVAATSGDTSVVWSSSNPNVASVDANGHVSMVGLGTAVITCTSVQVPDVFEICSVTVKRPPVTALALSQSELTLYTNDNAGQTLSATVTPSNAESTVLWSSSDVNVAVVYSDGLVKPVGVGTATITAVSRSTPERTASCAVTVVKPPVSGVTLDQTAMTVFTDNTIGVLLHASLSPEDPDTAALTWSSSNSAVAAVSADGLVTPVGVGTATVTVVSVSNPNATASCAVTVRRPPVTSVSLGQSSATLYIDNTAGLQLNATVLPADAEDPSLAWTSDSEVIATVSGSGLVLPANIGTATITATSVSNPNVRASCTVTVTYPPVSSVSLDRTSANLRTNDMQGLLLTATVLPAAAENTSVTWSSSDTDVIVVDEYGMVAPIGPGTATVTATSVSNPTLSASCSFTVKQFVETIYLDGESAALLVGETEQLTASVYPFNATDKRLSWSSSDPDVASVDANGVVTALDAGSAVITASALDGSGVSCGYAVTVEKMLQLDLSQLEDRVFTQGDEASVLAYVSLTGASALRMAKAGLPLSWTATKKSGSGDTVMAVLRSSVSENGTSYPTSLVSLIGSSFPTAGTECYTVRCTAGEYEDSVDVTVTVDGAAYAESLKLRDVSLSSNALTFREGEEQAVPSAPFSADGKPVPENLSVSVSGDIKYQIHATEYQTDSGLSLKLDQSDLYSATVVYRRGNLKYEVEAALNVTDENGVVHIRTEKLALDPLYLSMLQGESASLSAQHTPVDVYDNSLTWTSSAPSVASVSASGLVQAVSPGVAYITCAAEDGSDVSVMSVVRVEAYLQLDDNELNYTVYTGGEDHVDLGIVNVTIDSERRLLADGRNVTWTLERVSGSSTELGLSEFTAEREAGLSVSGNTVKLLRVLGAGTDVYRLSCAAGAFTDSCEIRVTAVEANLPQSIALNTDSFSGTVGEPITVDTAYTALPAGTQLPEDVKLRVEGGRAYRSALSDLYEFDVPTQQIFALPGTYTAELVFEGTNYSYRCPVSFAVSDEDGVLPANITSVMLSEGSLMLAAGESAALAVTVEPDGASYSAVEWASADTSVATVSANGTVTAIGEGMTVISASIPESDYEGVCLVYVEEGMRLTSDQVERTVFVDGETRMTLDTLTLSAVSSAHVTGEPQWTLRRVSGVSLTLRAEPCEIETEETGTLYGCDLILYSVSKEGNTVYELTCSDGENEATATVTVHAVDRDRVLPASITLAQTEYTADIGELIAVRPEITAYPAGTALPNGVLLRCEGDTQFQKALNAEDSFVSQSLSTFSFNRAGTYETRFVYAYSNVQYVVPVTFRIRDANGNVPVQTSMLTLNSKSLYLTQGETAGLEAIFTPANATNRAVSWSSSDTNVASVNAQGVVTAVGKGEAQISCIPDDPELDALSCAVTVEDYLTVDTGTTSRTLYLQGEQENTVSFAMLSVGTAARLKAEGITPVWSLEAEGAVHAQLSGEVSEDGNGITVHTLSLLSGGSDSYTLRCTAGSHSWSQVFTLSVVDLGAAAPTAVTIAVTEVSAAVNEAVTLDFTPIVSPVGAGLPAQMQSFGFVGIGDFYEALDFDVYDEDENSLTLAFTEPGQYTVAKAYVLSNLRFVTACTVTVGGAQSRNLLSASETSFTVYSGGKSGSVSTVSLNDYSVYEFWGDQLSWTAERISGDSMTVALKENGDSVDVFVANALKNGTDVWRVSCSFGGMTESVDLTLTTDAPRAALPERISLAKDRFTGMIGNWITVPIGAVCEPAGTMLPDQGDAFWSFSFDQAGEERSRHSIGDGLLRVMFMASGYYTGTLRYRSGNVSYSIPVYFVVQDEELEVSKPALKMFLLNDFDTVYPEGETGVAIAQVVVAQTLSTYSTGASVAYMKEADAAWTLSKTGSAANLSLRKVSDNVYDVILDSMSGTGDVSYTVSCTADGTTYTAAKTVHVAAQSEARPDATPRQTAYHAHVGETLSIERLLYSRADGSILQAAASFDPSDLLAAVGYEVEEHGDDWTMTFYESGSFTAYVSAQVSNLWVETPLTIVIVAKDEPIRQTVLKLPATLTAIGAEAFEGIDANVIDLRGTQIGCIGAGAFRNCVDVTGVYLPEGSIQIDDTAFYGCLNAVFYCAAGSPGAVWASGHGFAVAPPPVS